MDLKWTAENFIRWKGRKRGVLDLNLRARQTHPDRREDDDDGEEEEEDVKVFFSYLVSLKIKIRVWVEFNYTVKYSTACVVILVAVQFDQ